jgi:hypothetical protein
MQHPDKTYAKHMKYMVATCAHLLDAGAWEARAAHDMRHKARVARETGGARNMRRVQCAVRGAGAHDAKRIRCVARGAEARGTRQFHPGGSI